VSKVLYMHECFSSMPVHEKSVPHVLKDFRALRLIDHTKWIVFFFEPE